MCGVLGFIKQDQRDTSSLLRKGLDVLRHRGPDDAGIYADINVGLAHVRLSILDLTSAGVQPFKTNSGRFIMSYNGEVYNYKEIADELGIKDKYTNTDTEIIIRAFEKIGTTLFSKLNGMYSFAVLDRQTRKLWLVRDRLGIKPLYYKQTSDAFWYSSEIKGIFAMEGEDLPRYLNHEAVHEWSYYGTSLGENTLFLGIKRLLPGHYLEIDIDTQEITQHCYWQAEQLLEYKTISDELLIEKTKNLLESAVKRQLISDVPVGVFLSGGVDSSAITAFASKHYHGQLSTYSVAFDFEKENELPKARRVAQQFNTNHHEIHICGFDVADVVEKMVLHHDSPFADAANIPLYMLCNEIKNQTKVVLQGDGGDELFGGYQRYKTLSHLKKMKFCARLGQLLNAFTIRNTGYYRRQRYINALLAKNDASLMALLLTVEDQTYSPLRIFTDHYQARFEKNDPFIRYRSIEKEYQHQSLVNKMFGVDQSIILPDVFLEKVDKATMAASVEVRVPFLDHELVEFCVSLDAKQKLRNGTQKWLLKKALEGIVPRDILYGKKKGFGVPYGYWIKSSLKDLLQDHLVTFNHNNKNVLNMGSIQKMILLHQTGRRDFGFLLWKLLNFAIWSNQNKVKYDE